MTLSRQKLISSVNISDGWLIKITEMLATWNPSVNGWQLTSSTMSSLGSGRCSMFTKKKSNSVSPWQNSGQGGGVQKVYWVYLFSNSWGVKGRLSARTHMRNSAGNSTERINRSKKRSSFPCVVLVKPWFVFWLWDLGLGLVECDEFHINCRGVLGEGLWLVFHEVASV